MNKGERTIPGAITARKNGAFFVVDGTDGSGKATQTRQLVERLRAEGVDVETLSFPRYGKPSCHSVEQYLAGNYGSIDEVDPYRASLFFAVDRHDAASEIREWLGQGKTVIADRYVSSNMGHQAAQIKDKDARTKYLQWLDNLEYETFQIPRPDLTFVLSVTADVAYVQAKQGQSEKTKVKDDILESNIDHLRISEETYREIAGSFPNFHLIDCAPTGAMKPVEVIHEEIWQIARQQLQPTQITNKAKETILV